jgi:hypothetical protein
MGAVTIRSSTIHGISARKTKAFVTCFDNDDMSCGVVTIGASYDFNLK